MNAEQAAQYSDDNYGRAGLYEQALQELICDLRQRVSRLESQMASLQISKTHQAKTKGHTGLSE